MGGTERSTLEENSSGMTSHLLSRWILQNPTKNGSQIHEMYYRIRLTEAEHKDSLAEREREGNDLVIQ